MKRCLTIVLLVAGIFVAGHGAASAKNNDPDGKQYWGCVASITLDYGVCVSDPLPPDLPDLPATPDVPKTPKI